MPKYATIAIDSGHEWARLTFSYDMKKHARMASSGSLDEQLRMPQNYPGATERINQMVRRFRDYCKAGVEMVILVHEQIEKVYARGGLITPKGQVPQEPIAVKGWPNLPGSTCPTEVIGTCDNVFRVRRVNGTPMWICKAEPLGRDSQDCWVAKDRFNAPALAPAGTLPASYAELAKLAAAKPECTWFPPYIWMIYGEPGIGKTRSLLSFPRPLHIFDLDKGTASIKQKDGKLPDGITVTQFNSEEMDDYPRFVSELEACL